MYDFRPTWTKVIVQPRLDGSYDLTAVKDTGVGQPLKTIYRLSERKVRRSAKRTGLSQRHWVDRYATDLLITLRAEEAATDAVERHRWEVPAR
jgi:hypothetical protein